MKESVHVCVFVQHALLQKTSRNDKIAQHQLHLCSFNHDCRDSSLYIYGATSEVFKTKINRYYKP